MNKLKAYNDATHALMKQAAKYDVDNNNKFSLPEMVFLLRESFKQKLTYHRVFPNEPLIRDCDPATGFCLISSYYIYEKTGGNSVWDLMQTPAHWWLRHKQTGDIFDITYTQFNQHFPYDLGKIETRIENDRSFVEMLKSKSAILAKSSGLE